MQRSMAHDRSAFSQPMTKKTPAVEPSDLSEDRSTLTITLVQMDVILGEPKENFARAASLISAARQRGSDLVVLPELWSTGYDLERAESHASVLTGRARRTSWFSRFAALAKANRVWLTGSLLEAQADGKYYNCMPLYDPVGALKAAYRKVHLFRLMDEDRYLAPGQDTALLDLPWGRAGLAICYDLRFPELFRRYAVNGAQLILIPAEWPCRGRTTGARYCGRAQSRTSVLWPAATVSGRARVPISVAGQPSSAPGARRLSKAAIRRNC